ncbi:virion structural protein [Pseudomonas phage D6]|nr:virion structural protein [Pseudomonas phage D6]
MINYDVKEALLNRFNKATGQNVQLDDVNFINAGVWLQNACNAKVTIQAKTTSNDYGGTIDLLYNRYRIDEYIPDLVLGGKPGDFATNHEVLAYLRSVYQLPAYPEDFNLATISPTATSVTLTPRINAIAWLPPYPVTLRFE